MQNLAKDAIGKASAKLEAGEAMPLQFRNSDCLHFREAVGRALAEVRRREMQATDPIDRDVIRSVVKVLAEQGNTRSVQGELNNSLRQMVANIIQHVQPLRRYGEIPDIKSMKVAFLAKDLQTCQEMLGALLTFVTQYDVDCSSISDRVNTFLQNPENRLTLPMMVPGSPVFWVILTLENDRLGIGLAGNVPEDMKKRLAAAFKAHGASSPSSSADSAGRSQSAS